MNVYTRIIVDLKMRHLFHHILKINFNEYLIVNLVNGQDSHNPHWVGSTQHYASDWGG